MNRSSLPSELMAPEEFDGGNVVACVILGLSFMVGAPGNLLVIWTILWHVKQRSHTVVLILHLAVADLLVLITTPLWIYSLARSWVFGEASCKAVVYIINTCMYSSVFLITLMSAERFVAVRYPFNMMRWKSKTVMNRFLVVIWFLSFLLGIPAMLTQTLGNIDGTEQCLSREYNSTATKAACLSLETLVGFVAPFFIVALCCCLVATQLQGMHASEAVKLKSTILISSVVIVFALCWLPYHVINTVDVIIILFTAGPDNRASSAAQAAVFISGALAFISSSVNPVLYVFVAKNFQGSLRESRLVRLFKELASPPSRVKGTRPLPYSDVSDDNKCLEITTV